MRSRRPNQEYSRELDILQILSRLGPASVGAGMLIEFGLAITKVI